MLPVKRIKQHTVPAMAMLLVVSLAACASGSQNLDIPEYTRVSDGYIDETVLPYQDPAEADKIRSEMTKMLSNEYVELYMGPSYDIALIDTRTAKVWYSNEAIYDENAENYSEDQKKYAYSQLVVDYYRNDNAEVTVTSYPECYDGEQKDQVTAEVLDDVLSVRYSFGTDMKSRVIFQVISAETYEEIEKAAKAAIEEKKLSSSSWGRMKATYNKSEDGTRYELNPSATYIQTDNIEAVCKQLGYTRADVDEEEEKMGATGELTSTVPNFVITVNYTLDNADLLVTVDISGINEPEDFYLNRVSVLPGFGANTAADEGYMLLPDGSGSLIYNGSTASGSDELRVVFYGDDEAEEKESVSELSAAASFPVFGIKSGDASVFAIMESGDAMGGIDVHRANQIYVRNMIMPWFYYRIRGTVSSGQGSDNKNYAYSQRVTDRPYVVRYHLLYDDRASYSGMADYYRSYLTAAGALIPEEGGSDWYSDVNVVGALSGEKTVLGVTTDAVLAASDYASVQKWISAVGAEQLRVNYEGMFNGGVDGSAPMKLKSVASLGSEAKRDELLGQELVYPVISLQTVAKSGNGIKSNTDIAKSINKRYAFYSVYNLSTGQLMEDQRSFLISPMSYEKIGQGFLKAYTDYSSRNLLVKDAASLLYSDFNESRRVPREESKVLLCKTLEQLKEAGLQLKLDGINAYALKYGDAFTNVPAGSSKSELTDCEIPFAGMVLHGIVPYSVTPLNEAENYEDALLDMIESGANPCWRIITGDMSVLSDTEYTRYYSASADYWTKEIKAVSEQLADFYTAVAGAVMEDHSILPNGLIRVTYSNGYKAYINKTAAVQTDGSISVESNSFCFCNERGEIQ